MKIEKGKNTLKMIDKKLQLELQEGPFPYLNNKMSVKLNKKVEERVVFINNICSLVEKKTILNYLKKFGKLTKIWINNKNENKKKSENQTQNLFAQFKEKSSLEKILLENNKIFENRHLQVLKPNEIKINEPEKTIIISGLSENQDEEYLYKNFNECGKITKIFLIREKKTSKPTKFAYINFLTKISIFNALQKNTETLKIQKATNLSKEETKKPKITKEKIIPMNEEEFLKYQQEMDHFKLKACNPEDKGWTDTLYDSVFKHAGVVPRTMIRKALKKLRKRNVTGDELTIASNRIVAKAHSKIKREIFDKDDLLKIRRENIKRKKRIFKNLARTSAKTPNKLH